MKYEVEIVVTGRHTFVVNFDPNEGDGRVCREEWARELAMELAMEKFHSGDEADSFNEDVKFGEVRRVEENKDAKGRNP